MKKEIKFKKGDKVKVSLEMWNNHWFRSCIVVGTNKDNKNNYDVISDNGYCELQNVPGEELQLLKIEE
jgi:hypothetical protein